MTRWESSAWPLAGGSAMIFALAVVLGGAPWPVAFVAATLTVALWSLRAPARAGLALALIAWLILTGFDVHRDGVLRFTGWPDVVRLAALIGFALVATALGRLHDWSYGDASGRQEQIARTAEPVVPRQTPPRGPRTRGLNGSVR